MTALEIRAATAQDHPTFARLFVELGVDDAVPNEARYLEEVQPTTLFAERAGAIVGYAYYRVLENDAHLAHLVSAPDARRTGVGRALIEASKTRARAHGCTAMTLNTRPINTAAIALYESCGFRTIFRSRALRFAWSAFDALDLPVPENVRAIAPEDDARLEPLARLAKGTLAMHRGRTGRVLRVLEEPGGGGAGLALAVFDVGFPGAYPFFATSGAHALSLLRALRPHARPEDTMINMALEAQHDIADALVAAGASVRFEMLRMRVAL